jgi:hypothetical protein
MPAESYDATVARGGAPGAATATARAVLRDVADVDRLPCAGGAGPGSTRGGPKGSNANGSEPLGCEPTGCEPTGVTHTGAEHTEVGVTEPAPAASS